MGDRLRPTGLQAVAALLPWAQGRHEVDVPMLGGFVGRLYIYMANAMKIIVV
jgi:hypothetical protein